MDGIDNSVAIVSGGSSGIGRAAAQRFAAEGASVVVADVDVGGGEETVEMIEGDGGTATFVETDVSAESDAEQVVETAVETYGGLDFAFNNAGIEGVTGSTTDQEMTDWERVIAINLRGVFLGMRAQIPAMLEDDGGAIVNTASIAGLLAFPGLTPYVASKHGVVGLTKTAALEFAREDIRVNAICPGVIETPMIDRSREEGAGIDEAIAATPMNRAGEPSEIGDAAVWLCSEDASYVTGESLTIDGGYSKQ